jgi:hypothetical protein
VDRDKQPQEEHKLNLSAKVASITTLIAVIGLITAVVNNGGLNLLKAIWQPLTNEKKLASTPISTPNSTPSTSQNTAVVDVASIPTPLATNTPVLYPNSTLPIPQNITAVLSFSKNLPETECQSATPGRSLEQILRKQDKFSLTLGREVLPLLVNIEDGYYGNATIYRKLPIEFVCNVNSSYRQLKLVYGVHGANTLANPDNKLGFTVFLDNKPVETRQVVVGYKQEWILNLQGVKNVAFRTECSVESCPSLSFAEMSLY